jgi:hypothetical protein
VTDTDDAYRLQLRLQASEQAILAAAILAEKAHAGQYPAALPTGFTDPFTGKPLGYRKEGAGFVVYSTGPTGHFDGGRPGQPLHGEAVYRYPPPKPIPVPADLLK